MLHLTKVAFGAQGVDHLAERLAARAAAGPLFLTTRYLPKRHAEIAGPDADGGSLYWILKHQLVARSPILGFGDAPEGKVAILIGLPLVAVRPMPKRAHQGWRYLAAADAPADLAVGERGGTLPAGLARELAALALL